MVYPHISLSYPAPLPPADYTISGCYISFSHHLMIHSFTKHTKTSMNTCFILTIWFWHYRHIPGDSFPLHLIFDSPFHILISLPYAIFDTLMLSLSDFPSSVLTARSFIIPYNDPRTFAPCTYSSLSCLTPWRRAWTWSVRYLFHAPLLLLDHSDVSHTTSDTFWSSKVSVLFSKILSPYFCLDLLSSFASYKHY